MAHHADWDSAPGAPSPGFQLCFLTEDTHMSCPHPSLPHPTQQARLCSPEFSREEPEVRGGQGLTQSHAQGPSCLAAFRASGTVGGVGAWVPSLVLLTASLPSPPLPSPSVFILFAVEDPLLRPAGPPLSAQPSHPCSTRPRGTRPRGGVFSGGLCTPTPTMRELRWSGPLRCPWPCHPRARTRLPVGSPLTPP